MGVQFGSDRSPASTTTGGVVDQNGNAIISANNSFGQFPLGAAPLAQTLFGLPNGTFNLLPPVIGTAAEAEINNFDNPLPYWQVDTDESEGEVKSFIVYDETTNTTALRLTPGTAAGTSTYSVSTRSAVISDDNLSLRQKAIATLEKVGTYSGTSQFYVKLDATYYDHAGSAISTQPIGTVYDNGTISSITGFTTAGTAAVGISAAYVDLKFSLVTTQAVTSGISVDINTLLLQTSQGAGGGASSFLITERFDASTTWTVPTGVEYLVAVIAVGGGRGGNGGNVAINNSFTLNAAGGSGGNAGGYAFLRDLALGTATTVSVGIGAGGAGGTARTQTKPNPDSAVYNLTGGTGANGGATTFGSFLTATGGSASAGSATSPVWPQPTVVSSNGFFTNNSYTSIPYQDTFPSAGQNGSAGTTSAGESIASGSGGTCGTNKVIGAGGAGGLGQPNATSTAGKGSDAGDGAGGGGGAAAVRFNNIGTYTAPGGAGGSAAAHSGSGGGGGGGAALARASSGASYTQSVVTATSGVGGNGGGGYIIIAYIA
jgi:hypothetical protein